MSFAQQHQDVQQRHTNIAIVRMKKGGKKFEVAAYRNTVMSWRKGAETDLDEVLQVVSVFSNVSRGIHAKKEDLNKCFGEGLSTLDICKMILSKGEMQIGDKERESELANKFRDIATIVSSRCVNSQTGWPFTVSTIETAMKQTIHFTVNPNKPAKPQAFEVIQELKKFLPIARARIHVKIRNLPPALHEDLLDVAGRGSEIVSYKDDSLEILADPSSFRSLDEFISKQDGCTLAILQFSEISKTADADEEVDVDDVVFAQAKAKAKEEDAPQIIRTPKEVKPDTTTPGLHCSSCVNVQFNTLAEQRQHFKTEFHTFNVKLKNTGLPCVSANEFSCMSEQDKHGVLFDWKV